MDKFLKTLIETAVAPIVALLTEIRDQQATGLRLVSSIQQPPTVPSQASPAAPAQAVPAATNASPVPASNITREALGEMLLQFAKSSDDNMRVAQGFLVKYVPADVDKKTWPGIPESRYPELLTDLKAAIAAAAATPLAAKAAESLI